MYTLKYETATGLATNQSIEKFEKSTTFPESIKFTLKGGKKIFVPKSRIYSIHEK